MIHSCLFRNLTIRCSLLSSVSHQTIPNMIHQQEILENILSRLPAKSIGRFRCVSKPWNSLLSHPHFIKIHLDRIKHFPRQEESNILVSDESHSLYSTQLKYAHQVFDEMTHTFATKFNFDDHIFESEAFFDQMASCDGLVVVQDEDGKFLLINPTTREIKEVPTSPYALNPNHCNTMYGLGYDSLTDDYKVVTLSYYNDSYYYDLESDEDEKSDNTEMFVNVYSVKNGTWKRAKSSPYDHAVGHVTSGVFIDRRIHWLASRTSDLSSVIVAFDVEEEEYYEVPPPSSVDLDMFVFNRLVALGGCLCMFRLTPSCETDIWVMKEYSVEESWTKFTIIDSERSEFRPLCLLGKEQVVLVKDEDYGDAKLLIYNKEEGRLKDIVVQGIPDGFGVGGTFLESLVSPHCNNEASREG